MKNQVTSVEQSKRLLELGVPAEKASIYWQRFVGDSNRELPDNSGVWVLVLEPLRDKRYECVPAFTVVDLLGMLPKTIEEYGHLCELAFRKRRHGYGIEYVCPFDVFVVSFNFCNTAIDALEYAVEWFAKKRTITQLRISNEQWITEYLKGKDYTSPTEIGRAHAQMFGINSLSHHSAWASPICRRMVEKGLLIRNDKGHYKLNKQ